MPLVIINH